jgi:hypothetical protein
LKSQGWAPNAGWIRKHAAKERPGACRSAERAVVIGALIAVSFVIGALPASAAQPPHPYYVEGPRVIERGPGNLTGQLTVDQARQLLLVGEPDTGQVGVFDLAGEPVELLQTVGAGELARPAGLALDESNGYLYVEDEGNQDIVRYTVTGNPPVYSRDLGYQGPVSGAGPGQIGSFSGTLAVDPATGDLLVTDPADHRVDRYDPNGTFVEAINGSGTATGVFSGPTSVAVGATGDVYVLDLNGSLYGGGFSRLERFSTSGVSLGAIAGVRPSSFLAVDRAYEMASVAALNPSTYFSEVEGFIGQDPTGAQGDFGDPQEQNPLGLAVDESPGGGLYLSVYAPNYGGVREFVPLATLAPGVSIDEPSAASPSSEHVSGIVDAGDESATAATVVNFEYSGDDGASWTKAPQQTLPTGSSGQQAISTVLTGLAPNIDYAVRLKAVDGDAPTTSRIVRFATPRSAPEAITKVASDVTSDSATLPASINAFGLATTYRFEYGTGTSYGLSAPVGFENIIGKARTPQRGLVAVHGLTPNAVYHYRVVATNVAGTTYGNDEILVTDPSGGPVRGYEQVTPVAKGGAILSNTEGFRVKADGSAITLGTLGTFNPLGAESAPANTSYFAERSTEGWSIRSLDVPFSGSAAHLTAIFGISPDFTKVVTVSNEVLAPGAAAGRTNFYLENVQTGALSFAVSAPRELEFPQTFGGPPVAFFGNADWSRLYATSPYAFATEAIEPAPENLFELVGGQADPIGPKLPDGEPIPTFSSVGLSPDGTTLAYGSDGGTGELGKGAFLSANGVVTPISVSERSGDPATPQAARNVIWTKDGSAVIFRDDDPSELPLTLDAPPTVGNFYRYEIAAPAGHHLRYLGTGESTEAASQDGNTVVYERGGSTQLFASRNGTMHVLSEAINLGNEGSGVLISPNGRFVEVATSTRLTEEAPTSAVEIYLFDLDSGETHCVSCDGSADAGPAQAGFVISQAAPTDEGEVFFSTATSLVSGDSNGEPDVYSYKGGHVHLISRATAGTKSLLAGATPSGHDVFFTSTDKLVSQDIDSAADVYDARVGGGFASQNPVAIGTCSGSECGEAKSAVPSSPPAGSEAMAGARAHHQKAKRRHPVKRCVKTHPRGRSKKAPRCVKHGGRGSRAGHGKKKQQKRGQAR